MSAGSTLRESAASFAMSSSPFRAAGHTGLQQRTPSPVALSVRLPDSPHPPTPNGLPSGLPFANGLPNGERDSVARTGEYAAGTTSVLSSSSTDPSPGSGYVRRASLSVSPTDPQDPLARSSTTHFPPSPSSPQPEPPPHHLPYRPAHPLRHVRPRPPVSRSPSSTRAAPTPLPYAKLLPLLISRISEGLIFSVIFPYINEMVHSFGIREKDVGVWSAMAVSGTEGAWLVLHHPVASSPRHP